MPALERLFWRCDHAATHGVLDLLDAQACSAATDRLREERFRGDLDALLAWWRERKPLEHAALERGADAGAGAGVAQSNGLRVPAAPRTAR